MLKNYFGLIFLIFATVALVFGIYQFSSVPTLRVSLSLTGHSFLAMLGFLGGIRLVLWFRKAHFSFFHTWYHHSYALYSLPLVIFAAQPAEILRLKPEMQIAIGLVMGIRMFAFYQTSISRISRSLADNHTSARADLALQLILVIYIASLIFLFHLQLHNYAVFLAFSGFFWVVSLLFSVITRFNRGMRLSTWIIFSLLWIFYGLMAFYVTYNGLPVAGDFHSLLPVFFLAEVLYLIPIE